MLDRYTNSNLVYYKHKEDDEPYEHHLNLQKGTKFKPKLCVLKHIKPMCTLNATLKPCPSPTYFHSVNNLYANTTALNQGEELNEGVIGFSAYSLMSSSVRWNLISCTAQASRTATELILGLQTCTDGL